MSIIRVMSFNVFQTLLADDEIEHFSDVWANRAAFNVHTILRYRPDVIGFQELDHGHLATYRTQLADYSHCLDDDHAPDIGNALFWRTARFRRHDAGVFWLSRTPDVASSDWGVPYPLSVAWVRLEDRHTHATVLYANTQFEDGPAGEASRRESSQLLGRHLPELAGDDPVIAMGDFNCNPGSAAYHTLLTQQFTDMYRAAGHGDSVDSSTFHGFHGATYFALDWGDQLFWRVDWLLSRDGVRRVHTTSCTIVRDAEPPVFASDHYPVVAEFTLV